MELLKSFPLLVPVNKQNTRYKGFIQVQGESFHVEVSLPAPANLQGASLLCECRLRDVLHGYEDLVTQRLKQSSSLVDFLKELQRLIEVQLKKRAHGRHQGAAPLMYARLVDEIRGVGWDRLVYIDSEFRELHFSVDDGGKRRHVLKIHLQNNHPQEAPKCSADLPKAFDCVWTNKSSLSDLLDQFTRHLAVYQDFWDTVDELDQNTWVVEPERPLRGDTGRRIALGNNASVQLSVSVHHPRMLPECRLMGADHVVGPLNAKLSSNLHLWSSDKSLLHNLQTLLQIEFPSPAKTHKEDFTVECGICYSYRLGDEIPDQACDDQRCGQPYHRSCLYEWLRALPSFRQSFNVAFGECPYCSMAITVKMPTR